MRAGGNSSLKLLEELSRKNVTGGIEHIREAYWGEMTSGLQSCEPEW